MPATPVTSSSVASTTNGATRWNGRVTTMSSMSNSIGVLFTWQVLLVLRVDVALAPTSSQVEEHFPRQSHGDDPVIDVEQHRGTLHLASAPCSASRCCVSTYIVAGRGALSASITRR